MLGLEDGSVILTIALFALQGLWGVFLLLLTFSMRRILDDIKENTTATKKVADGIAGINVLLAGHYVTKAELDRLEAELHKAQADIIRLQERVK